MRHGPSPSVRLTASCVVAVACRPPVAVASSSIWKTPSGSTTGSKRSACSPARFQALLAIVATSAPRPSRTFTVTFAGSAQRVGQRRLVGDVVVVGRDRLRVGREPGDREGRLDGRCRPTGPIAGVTLSSDLIAYV